jgi:hypothetical protein
MPALKIICNRGLQPLSRQLLTRSLMTAANHLIISV